MNRKPNKPYTVNWHSSLNGKPERSGQEFELIRRSFEKHLFDKGLTWRKQK